MKECGDIRPDGQYVCNITKGHPGYHGFVNNEDTCEASWARQDNTGNGPAPPHDPSIIEVWWREDGATLDANDNVRTIRWVDVEEEARDYAECPDDCDEEDHSDCERVLAFDEYRYKKISSQTIHVNEVGEITWRGPLHGYHE